MRASESERERERGVRVYVLKTNVIFSKHS